MRILILGGTGLTGPHQLRYAVERGHQVTVFNRGRSPLPADLKDRVEQLHGDRSIGELRMLKGREWDVVIDNPTTLPKWARDSAEALKGSVGRYIFISTISVYADPSKPMSEGDPLMPYEGKDALAETMDTVRASGFQLYGPLKAISEQEVQRVFPDASAILRPGLIVGPGDQTDRFTYWPLRVRHGGEVLAPGTPDDPVQVIDARDLAEWAIRLAEDGTTGVFNATGPATTLTIGAMLDQLLDQLQSGATFTWVPADFLIEHGAAPWIDVPAWVPPEGETGALMRADIRRALDAGLTFRPLAQTVKDTLAWWDSLPIDRRSQLRAGLVPAARERALLDAWRSRITH